MHDEGILEKILKEGQQIETKFSEKKDWIKAVLYKCYESILEVEFVNEEQNIDEFMAIGDTVNCRFFSDNSEYFIEGWVSRIKSDVPQRVTIQSHKVSKVEKYSDEPVYDIFLGCIVRDDPKAKGIFSIAKKLSRHSIIIANKSGMKLNNKLYLELLLPQNVTFKSVIEVENPEEMKESKDFCAKISEPDILNTKILENFLIELRNAEPELYNKQNSFWKKNSKSNF